MKGTILKIGNRLGLTNKELSILGFLLITFTAGLIIKYSGWKTPEEYDYSDPDKIFDQNIRQPFNEPGRDKLTEEQKQRLSSLNKYADSISGFRENKNKPVNITGLNGKININTSGENELEMLPGIGEVTAAKIIEYRELNGGFKKIEDIMKVNGIGSKKFDMIKDFIEIK